MGEKSKIKQNILAAALAMFSAKGYDGVSVNDLVSAVGVTKPTLYYHFGSKEGLFDAVCQENYGRLNGIISESITYRTDSRNHQEDLPRALTNVATAYFSFAADNEMFYRLALANQYAPPFSPMYAVVQKHHFGQHEILGKLFTDPQFAWYFVGAINMHISLTWNDTSGAMLNEAAAKELVHKFMHGFMHSASDQSLYQYGSAPIGRY